MSLLLFVLSMANYLSSAGSKWPYLQFCMKRCLGIIRYIDRKVCSIRSFAQVQMRSRDLIKWETLWRSARL